MHLLVTKADYADVADLPEALSLERLRPHIVAVQRHRLTPLLTAPLLAELLVKHAASTMPGVWGDLHAKCVAVVVAASLARYMPFSQSTVTSHSMVRKTSTHSEPVDGRDLARMASIYDGEALSAEVELSKWLATHASGFAPYYQAPGCGCGTGTTRTPSVVVQPIRRPGYGPHRR